MGVWVQNWVLRNGGLGAELGNEEWGLGAELAIMEWGLGAELGIVTLRDILLREKKTR